MSESRVANKNAAIEGKETLAFAIRAFELGELKRVDKIIPEEIKTVLRKEGRLRSRADEINALKKKNAELKKENTILEKENAGLRKLVSTDPMTGLGNDVRYHEDVERVIAGYLRHIEKTGELPEMDISFLVIDGNGLKKINDTFDHIAGDNAIKRLGTAIKNTVRESDYVYIKRNETDGYAYRRGVGADEFIVILEGASKEDAKTLVERLKNNLSRMNAEEKGPILTFSVGISSIKEIDKKLLVNTSTKHIQEIIFKNAERRMHMEKEQFKKMKMA